MFRLQNFFFVVSCIYYEPHSCRFFYFILSASEKFKNLPRLLFLFIFVHLTVLGFG
jgi:hypothetical protein